MPQHPDPQGADARVDQLISLDTDEVEGGRLVTVTGELDMVTTPHLRSYLLDQLALATSLLVVDLRKVDFLGSSGLAVLVETLSQARDDAITLRLVSDSREVLRPLEATGLTDIFEIYDEPGAALARR